MKSREIKGCNKTTGIPLDRKRKREKVKNGVTGNKRVMNIQLKREERGKNETRRKEKSVSVKGESK